MFLYGCFDFMLNIFLKIFLSWRKNGHFQRKYALLFLISQLEAQIQLFDASGQIRMFG